MKIMVTGGCGFIGSAVCRHLVRDLGIDVVNVDKLTYAASEGSTAEVAAEPEVPLPQARHLRPRRDAEGDAGRRRRRRHASRRRKPCRPLDRRAGRVHPDQHHRHLRAAAGGALLSCQPCRSRRSRPSASTMSRPTRCSATCRSMAACSPRKRPMRRPRPIRRRRRPPTIWCMAWHHTYGLPVVLSNCSNNYGPYHFPEKLMPLMIINGMEGKHLPVYGTGENVRDWLHVEDHARALAHGGDEGPRRPVLQHRRPQRALEPQGGGDHRRHARRTDAAQHGLAPQAHHLRGRPAGP